MPKEGCEESARMLRSILVPLDGSASSRKALQVALELARQHGAHVEGLGIVDSKWIESPEHIPSGEIAIDAVPDLSALGTARKRVDKVLQEFRTQVAKTGVSSHNIRAADGNPLEL